MHKFSIPVDFSSVESVLESGFIADFNDIKFDGVAPDQQIKTAFLYFRNTGFKFIPDFSNCSASRTAEVLEEYLTTEYNVPNAQLEDIWLVLVLRKLNVQHDIETSLPEQDLQKLDGILADYVDELIVFINSLSVYGMFIADQTHTLALDGSVSRTNYAKFGSNLYNIMQSSKFNEVVATVQSTTESEPKFYNVYFTEDNVALMNIIKDIPTFGILAGIMGLGDEQ